MTIKTDEANCQPTTSPSSNVEEEIVVAGQAVDDPDAIPFATAIPVDDKVYPPSYNPSYSGTVPDNSYVTTAAGSSQPPSAPGAAIVSGSQYPPHITHHAAASPGVATSAAAPVATASADPPPGVAPGGRWVLVHGLGPNTWTVCAIVSAVFCVFTCLPCGLWAFLCPCDERRAYLLNGKLFDEDGGMVGSAHSRRYR
jgi:hypothetical protein